MISNKVSYKIHVHGKIR